MNYLIGLTVLIVPAITWYIGYRMALIETCILIQDLKDSRQRSEDSAMMWRNNYMRLAGINVPEEVGTTQPGIDKNGDYRDAGYEQWLQEHPEYGNEHYLQRLEEYEKWAILNGADPDVLNMEITEALLDKQWKMLNEQQDTEDQEADRRIPGTSC